ncbi:SMI1/KNR4 family protein [Cellulomonas xiejunii]|uniref:SMI1/KNR4 family protein n=1 Tax=Cellulomonas xiejunii TaxID=2968083 RepID=UPI001D0DFC17|nr:SMI1/KNR4 family protein [Cellulomonas xiejunii]MCC2314540.1 SMI1/KNR4 family protein [Cellulomonas xiejunii]
MPRDDALFRELVAPFEPPVDHDLIRSIEAELGIRLPEAYIRLSRVHNGGHLALNAHRTEQPTTWATDHVGITSIAAIGRTAPFSLCGELGNAFWVREWGYPDIGVYFADCPSAGHDMIALDYRASGEPPVVHVDQEVDFRITAVAPNFASFVDGLVPESDFP